MPDKYLWNEICGCLLLQRKGQLRTFVMQRDIWGRNVPSVWNWEGISGQNLPQNQTHQVRIKVSYQWSWWARYNTSNIPISVLGNSPDAQTVLRNTYALLELTIKHNTIYMGESAWSDRPHYLSALEEQCPLNASVEYASKPCTSISVLWYAIFTEI